MCIGVCKVVIEIVLYIIINSVSSYTQEWYYNVLEHSLVTSGCTYSPHTLRERQMWANVDYNVFIYYCFELSAICTYIEFVSNGLLELFEWNP